MNTRFSPSLNGSLHIGHLWMAWVNFETARQSGGRFVLRFDDVAPIVAGESPERQPAWAAEGEMLLRRAGIVPNAVSRVSAYLDGAAPGSIGGSNLWLRPPAFEGWDNVPCSPELVAARVRADIRESIDTVIRGEELAPELQLYEYLNHLQGGPCPRLVYLPRLRVRCDGRVTTISKTHGNLQLRDLYAEASPARWLQSVCAVGLQHPDLPLSLQNINPDPVLEIPSVHRSGSAAPPPA